MSEAVKVGPVVNGLKERVEELLVEWPDHPGLVQVYVSCVTNECRVFCSLHLLL